MLFGRDDECAGCCQHLFQRKTTVCRQRSMRRKICPCNESLRLVRDRCELSQPAHTSATTRSDPQAIARSVTPILLDALSE